MCTSVNELPLGPVCDSESRPGPAADGDVRTLLSELWAGPARSSRWYRRSRHHAAQHLPPLCSCEGVTTCWMESPSLNCVTHSMCKCPLSLEKWIDRAKKKSKRPTSISSLSRPSRSLSLSSSMCLWWLSSQRPSTNAQT